MPRRQEPPLFAVVFQTLTSLGVIIAGAHFFVDAVEHAAAGLGLPAGLIALILAPLATELPEKFNSIFWIREGKDTLALGNVTGAMMFQSTVPVAFGVLFTPWNLARGIGLVGLLGLAEAPQVRHEDVEALGQDGDILAVDVPELRPAVQQDERHPSAVADVVDVYTVRSHVSMVPRQFVHLDRPLWSEPRNDAKSSRFRAVMPNFREKWFSRYFGEWGLLCPL